MTAMEFVRCGRLKPGLRTGVRTRPAGFTLLELLVVIGAIGILAAASLPAIRGLTHSNIFVAGNRQTLDDLSYARQMAISGRRTVYMVFVPPTLKAHFDLIAQRETGDQRKRDLRQLTNLISGQFTAYALFSRKSVGDQPGQHIPRYLTAWKQVPEGMFVATNKFVDLKEKWLNEANRSADTNRPLPFAEFPFPFPDSVPARLPYIAFNARGQVVYDDAKTPINPGESVALTRGSILYNRDANSGSYLSFLPDVVETPPGNRINIRINWLTGRARVEKVEVQ